MSELFDKDFKAVIIQMLQGAIMSTFEINEKYRKSQQGNGKSQQRSRRSEEKPNGPFGTEKQMNRNYKKKKNS